MKTTPNHHFSLARLVLAGLFAAIHADGRWTLVLLGLVLWLYYGVSGGWLHVKLVLVIVMFAFYIVTGRWLKGSRGMATNSSRSAPRKPRSMQSR